MKASKLNKSKFDCNVFIDKPKADLYLSATNTHRGWILVIPLFKDENLKIPKWSIAISCNNLCKELKPKLLPFMNAKKLIIGIEDGIFIVNLLTGNLLSSHKNFFGPFNTFYHNESIVVAQCEQEILVFDTKCKFLFKKTFPDVIIKVKLCENKLLVTDMGNNAYSINLIHGKQKMQKIS